jgi:hypothetical protein
MGIAPLKIKFNPLYPNPTPLHLHTLFIHPQIFQKGVNICARRPQVRGSSYLPTVNPYFAYWIVKSLFETYLSRAQKGRGRLANSKWEKKIIRFLLFDPLNHRCSWLGKLLLYFLISVLSRKISQQFPSKHCDNDNFLPDNLPVHERGNLLASASKPLSIFGKPA